MSTSTPAPTASTTTSSSGPEAAAVALLARLRAPSGEALLIDSARQAPSGSTVAQVFEATPGVERGARAVADTSARSRFAGVVVGAAGEEDVEQRYRQLSTSNEFTLADHTKEGTDTDFLVEDAKNRPAFRINVKMYGTRFRQAQTFVGLDPEDTFGIATYKVRAAFRKSERDALPYLFAIASHEGLKAGDVAQALPEEVAQILDTKTLYRGVNGWENIENLLVEHLLDPAGYGGGPVVQGLRAAVASVEYRVISAIKANHLMNSMLDKRVPAVSNPRFKVSNNSQPNMHFSLSKDMIGLAELIENLETHGIQHVATKIAYHEI